MPTWTTTQSLHWITKLEATPSVKNYVSKILKEFTVTTTGARQLEAAEVSTSGRPFAAEDPSNTGERKVHLHSNTDGEGYIGKFDDLAKNFKPQSEEEEH